jgi:hypothetical protein
MRLNTTIAPNKIVFILCCLHDATQKLSVLALVDVRDFPLDRAERQSINQHLTATSNINLHDYV